jgi:two-component system OmpR family sensor kinase/two-component system phosphate regulon sensor histidine kinase PhoR
MKLLFSYNKKWLFYILSFFFLFTSILLVSEYIHERNFRIGALNEELGNYAAMVNGYIERNNLKENGSLGRIDSLTGLLTRQNLRITVIHHNGSVGYDSKVDKVTEMENHLGRPEIQSALAEGVGHDVRVSATTGVKYYYYAKYYEDYVVRISVVYDIDARKFIQPDRLFMLFVVIVFFITFITIIVITDKFGKSIRTLKEFTDKALAGKPIDGTLAFPENELGIIGQDIIDIYQRLNQTKEELLSEKAKLIRHLNLLEEGVAIFSPESKVVANNNHFIRFLNHISDQRVFTADDFLRIKDFTPFVVFFDKYITNGTIDLANYQPTYEITLHKSGKIFSVKSIIFQDRSFEVSINDITRPAKRKLLKQQMTDNIAHELKTPVSSIKGFLETILHNKPDRAKCTDFLQRAYAQSCRLADLVNDISLLTKIEEAGNLYRIEKVNLYELIKDIAAEIQPRLIESHIDLNLYITQNLELEGNQALLYSVFRNLFDNAISHAGQNLSLRVENYMEDKEYHYFSFSDTGTGVPEDDLPRLFERFYRVDKGRDRKAGGTGLGLAIVKNAIQFHKGDISVKNRVGGGLEFLFTLSKKVTSDE